MIITSSNDDLHHGRPYRHTSDDFEEYLDTQHAALAAETLAEAEDDSVAAQHATSPPLQPFRLRHLLN